MKILKRVLSVILCLIMLTQIVMAVKEDDLSAKIAETASALSSAGGKEGKLLSETELFPAGTSACDWSAMALAFSGKEESYSDYLKALEKYVEAAYEKDGYLDDVKCTTYHRIALTVMALGGDPTAFGEKPDGTPINLIADGTYNFTGESLGLQGDNGIAYSLIMWEAGNIEEPADSKFTKEETIAQLLSTQEADGGFGLSEGSSDVDITAMAVMALSMCGEGDSEGAQKAVSYLASQMSDTCSFSSYNEESAESCAQVILALCAMGIDPEKDERFSKNGENVLTALEKFRREDGKYAHLLSDTEGDYLATAQSLLALNAVHKLRTEGKWIFDFSGYDAPENSSSRLNPIYIIAGAVVVVVIVLIIVITGKRKKNGKTDR